MPCRSVLRGGSSCELHAAASHALQPCQQSLQAPVCGEHRHRLLHHVCPNWPGHQCDRLPPGDQEAALLELRQWGLHCAGSGFCKQCQVRQLHVPQWPAALACPSAACCSAACPSAACLSSCARHSVSLNPACTLKPPSAANLRPTLLSCAPCCDLHISGNTACRHLSLFSLHYTSQWHRLSRLECCFTSTAHPCWLHTPCLHWHQASSAFCLLTCTAESAAGTWQLAVASDPW